MERFSDWLGDSIDKLSTLIVAAAVGVPFMLLFIVLLVFSAKAAQRVPRDITS